MGTGHGSGVTITPQSTVTEGSGKVTVLPSVSEYVIDRFTFFGTGILTDVSDIEFQGSTFISGSPQLGDLPLQSGGIYRHGASFCGRGNTCDDEVGINDLIDHDICRPGFGDVGCQICEQILQFGIIRRDCYVGRVRIGRSVVQYGDVDAVCPNETDAVDDDPGRPGSRSHRCRRNTGGGPAVGKHDHDLRI